MDDLHLARDLEDKRVIDRNGREMGRVDRVVLAQARNGMAHVIAIEIGPTALGARLHAVAGRVVRAVEHVFQLEEGRPLRLPIEHVVSVDDNVKLDIAAGDTAGTRRGAAAAVVRPSFSRRVSDMSESAVREFRLDEVLGREVHARNGVQIGRLEELRCTGPVVVQSDGVT